MPDAENPYTPPEAELLPEPENAEYPIASSGKRFANYLIDRLGIYGFTFAVGLGLGLAQNLTKTDTTSFLDEGGIIVDLVFSYGLTVIYYTLLEGLTGASPGKWVTGTRAVMDDGSPLTFKAAILRSLCRLIPLNHSASSAAAPAGTTLSPIRRWLTGGRVQ